MKKWKAIPLIGSVLAAIAASSCCILPLLLGVAGAGSLSLSAKLAHYRPYFITLAMLMLGMAFYFAYRPRKVEEGECCDTESVRVLRANRILLCIVTLVTAAVVAYPNIAAYQARATESFATMAALPATMQTASFKIPSMDCPACALNIANLL